MEQKDAPFFVHLPLPFCNPSKSGIGDDPCKPFYIDIEKNTKTYTIEKKGRGTDCGKIFLLCLEEEMVDFDGVVVQNCICNAGNCCKYSRENYCDPVVDTTMSFTQWR